MTTWLNAKRINRKAKKRRRTSDASVNRKKRSKPIVNPNRG